MGIEAYARQDRDTAVELLKIEDDTHCRQPSPDIRLYLLHDSLLHITITLLSGRREESREEGEELMHLECFREVTVYELVILGFPSPAEIEAQTEVIWRNIYEDKV